MDINDINDKIRIEQLRLNQADSSELRNKIMTKLKILQLQKNLESIKSQIEQLKNRY